MTICLQLAMARPKKIRCVACTPDIFCFVPQSVAFALVEEVVLGIDELEAMRLADYEGLYQEEAAARMNVSRATFGRVVNEARRKVADAIIHGKALMIENSDEED